jgi:hypothetical protein
MPTVEIFGQTIEKKTLFIIGGLGAAGVGVVVYLRSRAAASQAAAPAPATDASQYGGGGMTVGAPTSGAASDYQSQIDANQVAAGNIANQYQQQLLTQQQKQFDFGLKQQQALAPAFQAEQQSQLAVETHYNTALSKAAVSCPGSASLRTGPDGTPYCRQKTSGGFLGIPLGDIGRTVQNFVGGVEAAAPSIGFEAAQGAAQSYFPALFKQLAGGGAPTSGAQGGRDASLSGFNGTPFTNFGGPQTPVTGVAGPIQGEPNPIRRVLPLSAGVKVFPSIGHGYGE